METNQMSVGDLENRVRGLLDAADPVLGIIDGHHVASYVPTGPDGATDVEGAYAAAKLATERLRQADRLADLARSLVAAAENIAASANTLRRSAREDRADVIRFAAAVDGVTKLGLATRTGTPRSTIVQVINGRGQR